MTQDIVKVDMAGYGLTYCGLNIKCYWKLVTVHVLACS